MKKGFIALVLALTILATMSTSAFALTNDGNGTGASSNSTAIPANVTYVVTFSLKLANGNTAVIGKYFETDEVPESYWVCENSVNQMLNTAVPGMTLYNAPENLVITIEPTKAHGELGEFVLCETSPRIILVKETGKAAFYTKSAEEQTSEEIPANEELPVTTGYSEQFEKIIEFFSRLVEIFERLYGSETVTIAE